MSNSNKTETGMKMSYRLHYSQKVVNNLDPKAKTDTTIEEKALCFNIIDAEGRIYFKTLVKGVEEEFVVEPGQFLDFITNVGGIVQNRIRSNQAARQQAAPRAPRTPGK